jgi:hypothetical protein
VIGGYAAARRWNQHFAAMESRAGERARKLIDERAAEIKAAFPQGATWSDWYDWMQANAKPDQDSLFYYGAGRASAANDVFKHFQSITGEKEVRS